MLIYYPPAYQELAVHSVQINSVSFQYFENGGGALWIGKISA